MLNRKLWSCYIKLTADIFSTHFCLDRCNWGTMKSLEIKIASFCELLQNRFYFKDVQRELSSWSARKFWNFWFHCIINTKNNNYHHIFVVVCLMTYIHVKLTLLFCYLVRLYKEHIKKRVSDKTKMILRRQKYQHKIYKCAKNRINNKCARLFWMHLFMLNKKINFTCLKVKVWIAEFL